MAKKDLTGLNVLVAAGPTREYLDPVRFLSNPSTGRMGYALATVAQARGAKVTLVSGPVSLEAPKRVTVIDVTSAAEMARATLKAAKSADIIIMTAAVADYTPTQVAKQKLKKSHSSKASGMTLRLKCTQDILAVLGKRKKASQFLVGFAAETNALIKNATAKLRRKNLDMIVANQVKGNNAFGAATNQVTVLFADGSKKPLPPMRKERLAGKLIDLLSRARTVEV